jgi:Major Facilitator Superfamily
MDYLGAAVLTVGCSAVILGLLEGGVAWEWLSVPGVGLPAAGVLLLIAFVLLEHRAAEPLLPLWVFSRRVLAGGNLSSLAIGALLIGVSSYVPTYAQGVLGAGPLAAGFVVAALSLGWPLAATGSGRLYLRVGFRTTATGGSIVVLLGTLACSALTAHSTLLHVAAACFVLGAGLGLCASPSLVAVQSSVGWDRRGVVTGATMFCRSMGSALGVAIFGAVANSTLAARLADAPPALAHRLPAPGDAAEAALNGRVAQFGSDALGYVRSALFDATHQVFLGLALVSLLAIGAALLLPGRPDADPGALPD